MAEGVGWVIGALLRFAANLFVVWPWRVAKRIFEPEIPELPAVRRANLLRAVIGFLIIGFVFLQYNAINDALFQAATFKMAVGIGLLLPIYLASVGMLIFLAPPERRGWTMRRMWVGPIKTLLILGGSLGLVALLATGTGGIFGVAVLLIPFLGTFVVFSLYLAWRHMFRAIDGHPLLPALTAPFLALAGTVADILNPAEEPVPPALSYALSFFGALVVTGLAWWEFRRMSHDLGVDLRSGTPDLAGPGPAPPPPEYQQATPFVLAFDPRQPVWMLHHEGQPWQPLTGLPPDAVGHAQHAASTFIHQRTGAMVAGWAQIAAPGGAIAFAGQLR